MKTMLSPWVLAPILALLPVAVSAAEPAAPKAESAIAHTPEQKAALEALDAELVRFDGRLAQVAEPGYREEVAAALKKFKQRRDALRQAEFDQGKYDELRFEINVEYQRVMMWLRPPPTPARTKNSR
jgi:Skp family chaperone for outer membrane proteins